jgi:NTE family protein
VKRIGLALGGGVVRGLAHIGVLRVFEREQIQADVICGTSIGAVVGGAYASGLELDEMASLASRLRWRHLVHPALGRRSLLDTERFARFLESTVITARDFSDLSCTYGAVACEIVSGGRVALTRGDPARAARASAAIRRIFPPVVIEGRRLVDGTVVDAVPVGLARELGATYVIGVDVLTRPPRGTLGPSATPERMIRPTVDQHAAWNFTRVDQLVALGEDAATAALPEIRRDLERGEPNGVSRLG